VGAWSILQIRRVQRRKRIYNVLLQDLCTVLWVLGASCKSDRDMACMLAHQDEGHAALFTQAVAEQNRAENVLRGAMQALR